MKNLSFSTILQNLLTVIGFVIGFFIFRFIVAIAMLPFERFGTTTTTALFWGLQVVIVAIGMWFLYRKGDRTLAFIMGLAFVLSLAIGPMQ